MSQHFTPSIAAAVALSAALCAIGCSGYPTGNLPNGRNVVIVNALQIPSDAPLAVKLDIRPLLQARRTVQQVAPAASPNFGAVTTIEVMVSGGNLTSPMMQKVNVADCAAAGQASFLFYLPNGSYKVVVNALDAAGQRVSYAVAEGVQVTDNNQTLVPVTCVPTTGSILIQWNCGACGTSPSPTSTPEAPSYTPPPSLLGIVRGLDVDDQGRVYLLGADPSPDPSHPSQSGRIIRVLPDRTVEDSTIPFYDNFGPLSDVEVIGGKLYTPLSERVNPNLLGGNSTHEVDLGSFPGTLTAEYTNSISFGSYDALGADRNNRLIGFSKKAMSMEDVFARTRYFTWDLTPNGGDFAPREIVVDKDNNFLWAATSGICAAPVGPDRRTNPTVLQPVPATVPAGTFGANDLAETAVRSNSYLVTYDSDTHLYLWNQGSGQAPAPVYDFAPDFPLKVELGPNGIHYVLVGKAGSLDSFRLTTQKYRVVRLRYAATDNTLKPVDINPVIATY